MTTAVEEHLEKKSQAVSAGSYRHTVLQAAKRFKSSWVEFGKLLTKVRNEALFEQWGYDSFDSYCFSELRIKKATADKLTKSYNFMEKHEPKALEREDIAETAPAWDVVSVLADAEERGSLSGSEYKSIRDSILEPREERLGAEAGADRPVRAARTQAGREGRAEAAGGVGAQAGGGAPQGEEGAEECCRTRRCPGRRHRPAAPGPRRRLIFDTPRPPARFGGAVWAFAHSRPRRWPVMVVAGAF
ncbi:MAG: hypothetical protein QM723_11695 [Myxococcaceae bacterium]